MNNYCSISKKCILNIVDEFPLKLNIFYYVMNIFSFGEPDFDYKK